MAISKEAKAYHEKMFPGYESQLLKTDPEFIELFDNFAFDEVVNNDDLDDHTRFIAILATLLGSQAIDEFKAICDVFDEDIYEAISVETCVNKRNTIGAPGIEAMKKVIALNEQFLAEFASK